MYGVTVGRNAHEEPASPRRPDQNRDRRSPQPQRVESTAEILKVRRATLSDLLHGKAALTPEMALRIEKAFGPDMNHLLRMQLAYDVAKTRKRAGDISIKRYVPA